MKNIIDGVDVSGCEFYTANIKYNCKLDTVGGDNTCFVCSNNPNCHYKQLQHAKNRLDSYNKWYEEICSLIGIDPLTAYSFQAITSEIEYLKQENERLSKQNFDYNIACTRLEEYGKSLKTILEDIKNEMSDKYQFGGLGGYEDFCKYYEREYSRIITKINEVLND